MDPEVGDGVCCVSVSWKIKMIFACYACIHFAHLLFTYFYMYFVLFLTQKKKTENAKIRNIQMISLSMLIFKDVSQKGAILFVIKQL